MGTRGRKQSDTPLKKQIATFVAELNGSLGRNCVIAFQFISLDKVDGHNLVWHLYSVKEKEYLKATSKFIEASDKRVKRTVVNLEYDKGPYYVSDLGTSEVINIPTPLRMAADFKSRLSYSYFEQELEFDIAKPPESLPPPGKSTNTLDDLVDYWIECLREQFGDCGSLLWVSQKHESSSLGRITSSVFCLFNEPISDDALRFRVSKQIREFIIDHNLKLYIAPKQAAIRTLERQLERLHLSDDEFVKAITLENPDMFIGSMIESRLLEVRSAFVTQLPILITGETGTGKEHVAKLIHRSSHRPLNLFIPLNCAGFSESDPLIDSHLFGHVKGAFTGAAKSRPGYFKQYSDGTIFIDEVHQLPRGTQGKLKRVVEYREFTPVGSDALETTNARLLFASNQSLWNKVHRDEFLEDLYYRISVIRIQVPPLRERMDEFDSLIERLLAKYRSDVPLLAGKSLEAEALSKLKSYHYPGNIRELQNVLLRALVISGDAASIAAEHILFDDGDGNNEDYQMVTDGADYKLAGVLKKLKLSTDDLARRHPKKGISLTSVVKHSNTLGVSYCIDYTVNNVRQTYLRDDRKDEILRLISLNKAYLAGSLGKLRPISAWLVK